MLLAILNKSGHHICKKLPKVFSDCNYARCHHEAQENVDVTSDIPVPYWLMDQVYDLPTLRSWSKSTARIKP